MLFHNLKAASVQAFFLRIQKKKVSTSFNSISEDTVYKHKTIKQCDWRCTLLVLMNNSESVPKLTSKISAQTRMAAHKAAEHKALSTRALTGKQTEVSTERGADRLC